MEEVNYGGYWEMIKPAYVVDGRNLLDKRRLEDIGFRAFQIGS